MDFVTIAEIELFRPKSVFGGSMGTSSNGKTGLFVVDSDDLEVLRRQVVSFASSCGIASEYLTELKPVSGFPYTHGPDVKVFDLPIKNVQFSTPYAACTVSPALRVGDRYFKLKEISGVSST